MRDLMPNFCDEILKAISKYKLILRKTLPASECSSRIRELGIKRNFIKGASEADIYKIGLKIIDDLKKVTDYHGDKKNPSFFYRGTWEFLKYLEGLFTDHRLEDERVVHVGQKASCALVAAIQLVTLSGGSKLAPKDLRQIKQYGDTIALYGTAEQKKVFLETIKAQTALRFSDARPSSV